MRRACVRACALAELIAGVSEKQRSAVNACKYLFTSGFSLVPSWNLQPQLGRCVKTRRRLRLGGAAEPRWDRASFQPDAGAKQLLLPSCSGRTLENTYGAEKARGQRRSPRELRALPRSGTITRYARLGGAAAAGARSAAQPKTPKCRCGRRRTSR